MKVAAASASKGRGILLFIVSSSLGTYLEFLDYTLFAYASKIISAKLLPQSENALAYTWIIFAASFLFRILGTIVFGSIGDRMGGKPALLLSMFLMSVSTSAIGFIPNFEVFGWLSPFFLLLFRSLQSFAVSPEYSGAATYLRNNGFLKKRFSFASSITVAVAGFGMLSGGYLMSKMIGGYAPADLPEWRWRLPFILSGILVGSSGLLLRMCMVTEDTHERRKGSLVGPMKNILRFQRRDAIRTIIVVGLAGIMTYTLSGYFANFLHNEREYALGEALSMTSMNSVLLCISILVSGYFADKFTSLTVLRFAVLLVMALSLPIFYLINTGSPFEVRIGLTLFTALMGLFSGPLPGFLASSFEQKYRYTGSSLGYNLGMSIFGGITPLSMLSFSKVSHYAPSVVITLYALLVFGLLRTTTRKFPSRESKSVDIIWGGSI